MLLYYKLYYLPMDEMVPLGRLQEGMSYTYFCDVFPTRGVNLFQ